MNSNHVFMHNIVIIVIRRIFPNIRRFSSNVPEIPPCDFKPDKYEGKSYEWHLEKRKNHIVPCFFSMFKKPLLVHQGHMQWLFDEKGRRYLDMFGGIVTVSIGHCHPKVVKETTKQMNKLWHTTSIYMQPCIQEYAEKLVSKMPGDLKVVYFVNSGSEANEFAFMLARLHTGNFDIISLKNCYHGLGGNLSGLTANSSWKYPVPSMFGIHHAMNPDPYNGVWGGANCRDSPIQTKRPCDCKDGKCEATEMYIQQLEEIFKYSLAKGKVGGFFAESIQGVGGAVQFTRGYIKRAAEIVRQNGGVYIADEVQSGFGRTGDHFWGFQSHDVIPDIVTMAKGIGNGFPLAAVVTTPEIAQNLTKALHFNTFGGNPIASIVGKTVLEVMEEENTQKLCKDVGTHLMERLKKLRDKYEIVGDVRGKGLMIGVELVENATTRKPLAADKSIDLVDACKDMGVLLGKGGLYGNILRIAPPMCITKQDADFTADVIERAIQIISK